MKRITYSCSVHISPDMSAAACAEERLLTLALNGNWRSDHFHATASRERKCFLDNLCRKINRLDLFLSSFDHVFELFFWFGGFFSLSGLLWLLWFCWKMAHGLTALSPRLQRERERHWMSLSRSIADRSTRATGEVPKSNSNACCPCSYLSLRCWVNSR